MSVLAFQKEIAASNRRTRRATLWSFAAHALALLLWLVYHEVAPREPSLVEVEWIEPEPVLASSVTPPAEVEELTDQVVPPRPEPTERAPQRFERPEVVAESEPVPQRPAAVDDRLRRSLSQLQTRPESAPALDVVRPSRDTRLHPAAAKSKARKEAPAALARGGAESAPSAPAALERAPERRTAPRLARVQSPDIAAPRPEMATVDENTARRVLDGALLLGPVADRPLKDRTMPSYPAWAKEEAVEASVTLSFLVAPDGRVRANVVVQKTSGHEDFDRNARDALRAWRFAPLDGTGGDQWGTITFHFRLRDR